MGSEMCIRDRGRASGRGTSACDLCEEVPGLGFEGTDVGADLFQGCLLYTSDAADERSSVDLGGRRIIKKKKHVT